MLTQQQHHSIERTVDLNNHNKRIRYPPEALNAAVVSLHQLTIQSAQRSMQIRLCILSFVDDEFEWQVEKSS